MAKEDRELVQKSINIHSNRSFWRRNRIFSLFYSIIRMNSNEQHFLYDLWRAFPNNFTNFVHHLRKISQMLTGNHTTHPFALAHNWQLNCKLKYNVRKSLLRKFYLSGRENWEFLVQEHQQQRFLALIEKVLWICMCCWAHRRT